jgi:hypothetical protein
MTMYAVPGLYLQYRMYNVQGPPTPLDSGYTHQYLADNTLRGTILDY